MEENEIKSIASAIVKIALIIALTVAVVFWGNSCTINSKIIEVCKESCDTYSSQMSSVTSRECRCESKTSDQWMLPRNL